MKKNYAYMLIAILIVMLCPACGNTAAPIDYGDDYVFGQDSQTFDIGLRGAAYTENGFYAVNPDNEMLLYYIDTASNKAKPLCNKPECNHNGNINGEKCNAFFDIISSVYYYDNNIYVIAEGTNEKSQFVTNLYRVSPDGSNRELVCCLFESNSKEYIGEDEASYSLSFIIHRGTGYMAINWVGDTSKEYEQVLYKVPLNGDSASELTAYKGYNPVIRLSYAQGNKIYYYVETRSKENGECESKDYCMDILTDNITEVEVPDKHILICSPDNKNVTMKRNDDGSATIYKSTGRDDAVELASLDYNPIFYCDYKYVYFNNSDKNILEVMDYTGAINSTFEVSGRAMCSDTKSVLFYDTETGSYNLYDIKAGECTHIDTENVELDFNPTDEQLRSFTTNNGDDSDEE